MTENKPVTLAEVDAAMDRWLRVYGRVPVGWECLAESYRDLVTAAREYREVMKSRDFRWERTERAVAALEAALPEEPEESNQ